MANLLNEGADFLRALSGQSDVSTLTVHGAPPRSAQVTAALGTKKGRVSLYNADKAAWETRFCVLLPSTLLFCFDDAEAESPRTVVDLQFYSIVNPHQTALQPFGFRLDATQAALRPLTFACGGSADVDEWMTSLHKDRFAVVREERDAYQMMQTDFTTHLESAHGDAERAQGEAAQLREAAREVRGLLGEALGLGEAARAAAAEEEPDPDVVADARRLVQLVREAGEARAEAEARAERLAQELAQTSAQAGELEAVASGATEAHAAADATRHELRKLTDDYRALLLRQDETEAKVAELTEQRRVLIREVKSARRAAADCARFKAAAAGAAELRETAAALEAKLTAAAEALSAQREQIAELKASGSLSSAAAAGPSDVDEIIASAASARRGSGSSADDAPPGLLVFRTLDGGETAAVKTDVSPTAAGASAAAAAAHAGDLSENQRRRLRERERERAASHGHIKLFGKDLTLPLPSSSSAEDLAAADDDEDDDAEYARIMRESQAAIDDSQEKLRERPGGVIGGFMASAAEVDEVLDAKVAQFKSKVRELAGGRRARRPTAALSEADLSDSPASVVVGSGSGSGSGGSGSVSGSVSGSEDGEEERPFELHCHRCNGVVAGPKNSTCSCDEPMLQPPEPGAEPSLSSMFKGVVRTFNAKGRAATWLSGRRGSGSGSGSGSAASASADELEPPDESIVAEVLDGADAEDGEGEGEGEGEGDGGEEEFDV